jgi:hypothetical protein
MGKSHMEIATNALNATTADQKKAVIAAIDEHMATSKRERWGNLKKVILAGDARRVEAYTLPAKERYAKFKAIQADEKAAAPKPTAAKAKAPARKAPAKDARAAPLDADLMVAFATLVDIIRKTA